MLSKAYTHLKALKDAVFNDEKHRFINKNIKISDANQKCNTSKNIKKIIKYTKSVDIILFVLCIYKQLNGSFYNEKFYYKC